MAGTQARNTGEIVFVPADVVQKAERYYETRRKAQERYWKNQQKNNHHQKCLNSERPFIMWDGEGPQDTGYALFGNSEGFEICHPYLETEECLTLMLDSAQAHPDAVNIAFGFNYDASMILRQLSWRHFSALKHYSETVWHGYEIQHIPHKWLKVTRQGVTCQIFDIRNFFAGSYVNALEAMSVGSQTDKEYLSSEKARRSQFLWREINEIRDYWRTELRLGVELCTKLRDTFLGAGFDVRSWHGPGALANMAMRRHGVYDCMAESPPAVRAASRYAFAGGRFEMPRGGYIRRRVYVADIHSAYPHYARRLPNLTKGTWRKGTAFEIGKFAVYRIRYRHRTQGNEGNRIYPLFRRLSSGEVVWANEVEGWYWAPEAELVKDDPDAQFLEAWIFDEDNEGDRPFDWLSDYYDKRTYLKRTGSPLELTFKLIINSVYGRLAQRTGWNRKTHSAPRSHQLEWAGYITSACRAAIYKVALDCGENLVSIDTDGVTSMAPYRRLDEGRNLGQWEVDEYDEGIFWQSGIYALRRHDPTGNTDGWIKGRTRGIPRGSYEPADLIHALEHDKPLHLKRKLFIGYGLALNGQREKLNTWETREFDIWFGGQGKRYHNEKFCKRICMHRKEGVHEFVQRPVFRTVRDHIGSVAHYLPWLDNSKKLDTRKRAYLDEVMYDVNNLEPNEEWVREYADAAA